MMIFTASQCEQIGTANIADYSCICKVGFTGAFCEKCDVDYHYHESYCHCKFKFIRQLHNESTILLSCL